MPACLGFGGCESGFDGGRHSEFSFLRDAVKGTGDGFLELSLRAGAGCEGFQGVLEFFWFGLLRGFRA